MKKVLAVFTAVLLMAVGFASNVQAEGEIELYPYDNINCLLANDDCPNYKVGDAHWDLTYNGYNYNFVNGAARFASDFDDANLDGFIDATEMPAVGWNAFASLNINNTASEVILKTQNSRTDLTSVVHRIYAYFDENGKLAMFEDHYVSKHYIFNDGTEADPDWRLATQAEADAYDAADPKPADTMYTTIRMALDDTDSDGYVIEPIHSLAWYAEGVDTGVDPVADWSSIIDEDPNNVVIPAGWTVMTFGTLDRDGTNSGTVDFFSGMPAAMAADADAMVTTYDDQPAMFSGLTALDDDAETPGVNIVVDYNGTFDLDPSVTASWTNMFDDISGDLINETEMLDYSVEISDETGVLETIDFTYDGSAYTASAAVSVVDSSDFGHGYVAKYMVTTPEGDLTEVEVDVVVGVMPPKFVGVEDRYINEDMAIDLGEGITADDGYGNDKTDSIMISYPDDLNVYYPQPGEYQIDLEFTHHVHFDGTNSSLTIDGVTTEWDESYLNTVTALSDATEYAIWTDADMVHDVTWGWGRVLVLVGADGLVDAIYDRYSWDVDDETGAWNDGGASFETWKASVVIEDGGFVIGSYGSTLSPALRDLAYDSPISYELGVPDFDYDIVTETSYVLTVDDTTAPVALVVDENFSFPVGEFNNANNAILSNVVAFDNYDGRDDLSMYVSSNGGLIITAPGTYTVEVTVEDYAGNSTVVSFDVVITEASYTDEEIDAALEALETLTEEEINALIDGQDLFTEEDVQALLDDQIPSDEDIQAQIDTAIEDALASGCGSSLNIGSTVIMSVIALSGLAAIIVARKKF